jgi:ligand-binding SRPBCC domain-containing protein
MKHRLIVRSSIFPADADTIWTKLSRLSTLQHVAKPYATFRPVDGSSDLNWLPGEVYRFRFRLFGVLPLGTHTIKVKRFDREAGIVYTEESNPHVPVWNHTIKLEAIDGGYTLYTDEVEIDAGWKTAAVCLWAKLFYAHRQRKWVRMLTNASEQAKRKDGE